MNHETRNFDSQQDNTKKSEQGIMQGLLSLKAIQDRGSRSSWIKLDKFQINAEPLKTFMETAE